MTKRWQVFDGAPIQTVEGIHPIAGTLFARRGLERSEDIASFLDPQWETGIHNPSHFRQMDAAVDRVFQALENGERITVHGDYDADGVTGSAVLISTLKQLGGIVDPYIPHRDKEGYGMNPDSVEVIRQRGTTLIITVDCGIANVEEIALAKSLGMDVIVVDHHQFGDVLPEAILIHPRLPGETYPFPHLAAVGVAWKFACALIDAGRRRNLEIPDGWEKWLLDLVAIATVTDMVPLIGENRVLETYGLRVLNKTRRPGLRKLIDVSGIEPGKLTSESVAFTIGPRINAAGRMEHATLALNLLLAENDEDAERLAKELEGRNRDRQKATAKMMEEAEGMVAGVESQKSKVESPLIAVWSDAWSPSLVGLVAGKFLDRMGKPAIAIGKHGDRWIGSGRSFAAFDITQAVKIAGEGLLTHSGGHVQACGFSFSNDDHLSVFIERLHGHAAASLNEEDCVPILPIDAELRLDDVNWQLLETIQRFEPFGEGNKRPLFVSRGLTVVSADLVGQQQNHVRCRLRSPFGRTEQFIGFKLGDRFAELAVGNVVDVVYDVGVNEWNGRRNIQCKIVDLRKAVIS